MPEIMNLSFYLHPSLFIPIPNCPFPNSELPSRQMPGWLAEGEVRPYLCAPPCGAGGHSFHDTAAPLILFGVFEATLVHVEYGFVGIQM